MSLGTGHYETDYLSESGVTRIFRLLATMSVRKGLVPSPMTLTWRTLGYLAFAAFGAFFSGSSVSTPCGIRPSVAQSGK